MLCSIETDKATIDYEMQDEGYIAKTMFGDGAKDIPLGTPLAILVDEETDIPAFSDYVADSASEAPVQESAPATPEPVVQASSGAAQTSAPATPQVPAGGRVKASPLAQNAAADAGIALATVAGTGPGGRILKADIEDALKNAPVPAAAPQKAAAPQIEIPSFDSGAAFTDYPNSQIRKVIAERLTFSKQNIPHYYVTVQVSVDNLMKVRAKLNKISESKLSVNDFVMKAAAMASIKVPATNSSWNDEFIRQFANVNMCFAVQTDNGLMAPVVQNVNLKGLEQIATEVKEIAGRARENKLKPEELSGGTFTVSNLGMYGVNNFSAIVNPPQACILAVGGAVKTVVPNEDGGDEPFKVAHLMNVTLSSDHRVVDGALAAQWGQQFKKFIENPEMMLL